jgi:hypothetical protein
VKTSKSNLNFDFIEFEISEKDLDVFKNSIAQGCIRRVDQISLNKWHYLLRADDRLLEIELSYNKNNIKQFHCACGARSPGKICKHVQLVSYWHVNTIRSKKDSQYAISKTVQTDLSESSPEDLQYYIQFLVRQNKLNREWIYFFEESRKLSSEPIVKYNSLFDRFLQFVSIQTRNSVSKIKLQLQLFEELYYISFYHYKQSNVYEAIHALLAGIHKLHELHFLVDWKNQSRLLQINEKLHTALEQFLTSIIAPRALNSLYKLISETMLSQDYLILNAKSNLFHILKIRFSKSSHSKQNFQAIVEKLNLNIREEYKFNLLDYLYDEYPELLKDYLISIELNNSVYWVLSWLDNRKSRISNDYLYQLYTKIYEVANKEMKTLVALKIADLYSSQSNPEAGKKLIKYYLETGHTKLLESYFKESEFSQQEFEQFLENLESVVAGKTLSIVQKIELANYSKQWLVLLKLISTSGDIELLMKYDLKFPEEFHPKLIEVYILFTRNYLDSHVGQKSHQRIELITRHIKMVYRSKLFTFYANELKQLFPNRKLLAQN